jgi:hypothetical protein
MADKNLSQKALSHRSSVQRSEDYSVSDRNFPIIVARAKAAGEL